MSIKPNKKFGVLETIHKLDMFIYGDRLWICRYKCGKRCNVKESALLDGSAYCCGNKCPLKKKAAAMINRKANLKNDPDFFDDSADIVDK